MRPLVDDMEEGGLQATIPFVDDTDRNKYIDATEVPFLVRFPPTKNDVSRAHIFKLSVVVRDKAVVFKPEGCSDNCLVEFDFPRDPIHLRRLSALLCELADEIESDMEAKASASEAK
jgi:hypothetical protein